MEDKESVPTDRQVSSLASRIDSLPIPTEASEVEIDQPAAPSLLQPELDVRVKLADQQSDPSSPLYSVSSFEELGLSPDLLKGIYAMKFQRPSKIQERALPLMLREGARNMIAQSQSGTGKTAAFVLAMLSRIDFSNPKTQHLDKAICLSPSRELARQTMSVLQAMGQFTPVTCAYAIKDAVSRTAPIVAQVVVGTPGTVIDLMRSGKHLSTDNVKTLVLDEADNMLNQQDMAGQCIKIKGQMPADTQYLLFSATFPAMVKQFAAKFAPSANEISLKQAELSVDGIKQFYMDCADTEQKFDVLVELYALLTIGQSIIFVATRATADKVAARMIKEGHQVTSLHGSMQGAERDSVIDAFRDGKSKVLITTNVIARGIDIMQVNMVVNYDIPLDGDRKPDPETYLHRIGRTGRFGRKGVSINFVHDRKSWEDMHAIEVALGREITRVETKDYDEMEKTIKTALKA